MNIAALSPDAASLPAPRDASTIVTQRQASFDEVLGRHSGDGTSSLTPIQKATSTAEQLVSVALVQPLLTQMRETNHAAAPFAPTQAEKQMRALQDANVAQQIVHASRLPIVDRLARGMLDLAERQSAARAGSRHS